MILLAFKVTADDLYLVSSSNSLNSSIDVSEVKRLFVGQRKSLQSQSFFPVLLTQDPDYASFLKQVVGKSRNRYERDWKKLLFTGKAMMPQEAKSWSELVDVLKLDPRKISFKLGLQNKEEGLNYVKIKLIR